jgi:hypothetical protein
VVSWNTFPITTQHLPLTTYHSPLTTLYLPLTIILCIKRPINAEARLSAWHGNAELAWHFLALLFVDFHSERLSERAAIGAQAQS